MRKERRTGENRRQRVKTRKTRGKLEKLGVT